MVVNSPGEMTEEDFEKVMSSIETNRQGNRTERNRQPYRKDQFCRKYQKRGRNLSRYFVGSIGIVQVAKLNIEKNRIIPHVSEAIEFNAQIKRKNYAIRNEKYRGKQKKKSESKLDLGQNVAEIRDLSRIRKKIPYYDLSGAQIIRKSGLNQERRTKMTSKEILTWRRFLFNESYKERSFQSSKQTQNSQSESNKKRRLSQ